MKLLPAKFLESPTLQPLVKVGGNVLSLLTSTMINRIGTFVVYLLVGRYLGAFEFGQFSLGITYFQTFQLLAIAGLQTLITREVAKDKSATNRYLMTGSAIILLFSAVSLLLLWITVSLLNYEADTQFIILLIASSLLPYALGEVCNAVFRAWERMHHIATSNLAVTVAKIGLTYLLLSQGYGLVTVAFVIILTHTLGFVIKLAILIKTIVRPAWAVEIAFGIALIKSTLTFLGIRGAKAILNSLDIIIISKLIGEVEVGLITAAAQLLVPIGLILDSTIDGVFPLMCRSYEQGLGRLKIVSEQLLEGMLMIVIPATVGIFMFSESILVFLYGAGDFVQASLMLQIMVWTLILRTFTRVLGSTLIATMQEKKTLRILLVDVGATILIAPIMIVQFGLVGAAIAVLAVRVVDALQHYMPVVRTFPDMAILRSSWKPLLASTLMFLVLEYSTEPNLFLNVGLGILVYAIGLATLLFVTIGGLEQIKMAYLGPWVKQAEIKS